MSGSMWQGMETRQGDGTEALSQETESNGSATPKSRRHPLTLPVGQRLRRSQQRRLARNGAIMVQSLACPAAAAEPFRWAAKSEYHLQPMKK